MSRRHFFSVIPVLAVALTATPVLGQEKDFCDSLVEKACDARMLDDGTLNTFKIPEELANPDQFNQATRKILATRLDQILSDPSEAEFKSQIYQAIHAESLPSCQADQASKSCQQNIRAEASKLAESDLVKKIFKNPANAELFKDSPHRKNLKYAAMLQGVLDESERRIQSQLAPTYQKIESEIFPDVMALVVQKIKKMNLDPEKKQAILQRVSSITFNSTSLCNKEHDEQVKDLKKYGLLQAITSRNASYNPGYHNFRVCSGWLLEQPSLFDIVGTIAHEVTHAFDPCTIATSVGDSKLGLGPVIQYTKVKTNFQKLESDLTRNFPLFISQNPFSNILSCLQDPLSAGVKVYVYSEHPAKAGACTLYCPRDLQDGELDLIKSSNFDFSLKPFCSTEAEYSSDFSEAFADWMSAEIIPEYMDSKLKLNVNQYRNGYSNALRKDCLVQKGFGKSDQIHPSSETRISRILALQPKIRSQMKCSPNLKDHIYCSGEIKPGKSPFNRDAKSGTN